MLAAQPDSLVLRTSWVHAAGGRNFVRTMLRLAEERDEVAVVCDQRGCPSYAPHLADALVVLARKAAARAGPFGVHHMAGGGATTWAGLAQAIFAGAAARGAPAAGVRPIRTTDYPTPAPRPANSQLDCGKLARDWGVRLPRWEDGLEQGLDSLLGRVVGEVRA